MSHLLDGGISLNPLTNFKMGKNLVLERVNGFSMGMEVQRDSFLNSFVVHFVMYREFKGQNERRKLIYDKLVDLG